MPLTLCRRQSEYLLLLTLKQTTFFDSALVHCTETIYYIIDGPIVAETLEVVYLKGSMYSYFKEERVKETGRAISPGGCRLRITVFHLPSLPPVTSPKLSALQSSLPKHNSIIFTYTNLNFYLVSSIAGSFSCHQRHRTNLIMGTTSTTANKSHWDVRALKYVHSRTYTRRSYNFHEKTNIL